MSEMDKQLAERRVHRALDILRETGELLAGERQIDYGSPERCFGEISAYWSQYLGRAVTPKDVAVMMILLKVARVASGKDSGNKDGWVDICGYAALGGQLTAPPPTFPPKKTDGVPIPKQSEDEMLKAKNMAAKTYASVVERMSSTK